MTKAKGDKPRAPSRLLPATHYGPVIGLEIHAQVKTKSKMFCGCPAETFGKEPNSITCPVCLGLPGAMPVPNSAAIEKTVVLAKALGCQLAKLSQFERKNYFYPDLPKGFQISQYSGPIGVKGRLGGINITRVHLEEDTGKLMHADLETLIDFNRSGVPLIEIVTEPEFSDPRLVSVFLKELRTLLVHLEISDADMEKGSLRLEANISLRKVGEKGLPPYKVELKNINSFAFLEEALEAEIIRQKKLLGAGEKVLQETRGFDEKRRITVSQRRKEEAFDYRYFPEPDLPPLTEKSIVSQRMEIKTPDETRKEYQSLGLPPHYVNVLISNRQLAALFEEMREEIPAVEAANILINQRFGDPHKIGAEGLKLKYKESRKKVLLTEGEIRFLADKILLDNPAAVADYAKGKENALQFLLGQLMKESGGKIDPQGGRELLKDAIKRSLVSASQK